MFCRNCGKELIGTPEICVGCGVRPGAGNSHCQACGSQVNALAEICIKCGSRLATQPPARSVSVKSRLIASLFAFFIGQFGAHRFYVGKVKTAIAMAVLGFLGWVTVAAPGKAGLVFLVPVSIWALIDFIVVISGNMNDSKGNTITKW